MTLKTIILHLNNWPYPSVNNYCFIQSFTSYIFSYKYISLTINQKDYIMIEYLLKLILFTFKKIIFMIEKIIKYKMINTYEIYA